MSGKSEPRCPTCTFRVGHADDCQYRSPSVLSHEERIAWRVIHGLTGSLEAADVAIRRTRAHINSDDPSMLNDPSLAEAETGTVEVSDFVEGQVEICVGGERVTVRLDRYNSPQAVVDAINKELGKRDLPQIMEPW